MRTLIVGCGYVGLSLASELVRRGHEVFGLRRSAAAEPELAKAGAKLVLGDITSRQGLDRVPADWDWVVNCAAASGGGLEDYWRLYATGTRNLVDWLATSRPRAYVYTSSTSVYGQMDGSLVSEESSVEPVADTARILVETEQVLREAVQRMNFPAITLRVAGIYGPGRGHWFKQFLRGQARIEDKGERILNMIHRDDVAGAIVAALERGTPGSVYNAVDDEPVSQLAFFQWLADTLGRPLPPSAPDAATDRKRGNTNKRVSNCRLKAELGYQFKFPTFREGYGAALRDLQ